MAPFSTRSERQMLIRSDAFDFADANFHCSSKKKKLDEGVRRNDPEMEMDN